MYQPHARLMISLAVVLLGAVGAQYVSAAPGLDAQQIVDRNAAARGGMDRWRQVKILSMSGQMDANKPRSTRPDYHPPVALQKRGPVTSAAPPAADPNDDPNKVVELPYRLEMKRPRATRLEVDFNGKTSVQIYDGSQGVKIRPYLGRDTPEPYTKAELELAAGEPELDGFLIDYARKGSKIAVEGVEPVEGHEAYKLKVTLKDGTQRRVWVDAASFLEVKLDGSRRLDGKPHALATYLRNYKTFDGLKIPTLNETKIDGISGSTKLTVDAVTVNPVLADSRFDVAQTLAAAKPVAKPVKPKT